MELDPDFRSRGAFPVERPMDALTTDHALVRRLFEHYFDTRDEQGRRDHAHHLIVLLDMHAALEEQVFYRYVYTADPALVDRCVQEHEEARQVIAQIQATDYVGAHAEALMRQLSDLILRHIETEENQLFAQVALIGFDLADLGREMQTFELTMIADRMQKPIAPGLRQ